MTCGDATRTMMPLTRGLTSGLPWKSFWQQRRKLASAWASNPSRATSLPTAGRPGAWMGKLDYDLIFELHADLPVAVPVIIQDAAEQDVPRTRDFLLAHSGRRE
jgi:hypothetical protein